MPVFNQTIIDPDTDDEWQIQIEASFDNGDREVLWDIHAVPRECKLDKSFICGLVDEDRLREQLSENKEWDRDEWADYKARVAREMRDD